MSETEPIICYSRTGFCNRACSDNCYWAKLEYDDPWYDDGLDISDSM